MPNVQLQVLIVLLSLWSIFWKAVALWRAAKYEQRGWFSVLFVGLIVNFLGIIELIFLFKFSKKPLTIHEIKSWKDMIHLPQKKR